MAKCSNCGADVQGAFCSLCGTPAAVALQPAPQPMPMQPMRVIQHPVVQVESVQSLQSSLQDIGRGNITNRANFIQGTSDEGMVWEDSPSLILLIGPMIKYFVIMAVGLWLFANFAGQSFALYSEVLFGFLLLRLGYRLLKLKSIKYRMSSQRLVIDSGVFTRVSVPYEVHQLGNAIVSSTMLLRMVGRGTVNLGGLSLQGIRNPEAIRDLLRNAGQWEAGRVDKIRWR
jgi:hypothetical protein